MKKNINVKEAQTPNVIGKVDTEKMYQMLGKLLSEDQDYEVKFTVTKKEE